MAKLSSNFKISAICCLGSSYILLNEGVAPSYATDLFLYLFIALLSISCRFIEGFSVSSIAWFKSSGSIKSPCVSFFSSASVLNIYGFVEERLENY